MTALEKIGLAVVGIEAIGMWMIGKAFKKAIDEHVQMVYDCENTQEYLLKVKNGEIEIEKR